MNSESLERILRVVVDEFQADLGTIHLLDAKDGMLYLAAVIGQVPPPVRAAIEAIPIGKGIAGECARRREPVSICNLQRDDSGVTRPGAKTIGTQGALCVPVFDGDRLLGTLGIGSGRERTFSEEETARLLQSAKKLAEQLSSSQ